MSGEFKNSTPILNEWFGITEFGDSAEKIEQKIQEQLIHNEPLPQETFHDLLSELASLGFHHTTLVCIEHHDHHWQNIGFHQLLFEGASAMICKQFPRALSCLQKAHHLMPTEPAPVINLIKIYLDTSELDQARIWLNAGLKAHPNHVTLWSLYVDLLSELNQNHADLGALKNKAHELSSWQGHVITQKLKIQYHLEQAGINPDSSPEEPEDQRKIQQITTQATQDLAQILDSFYHTEQHNQDFLTEYTAVLGAAGEYEKIPPILWHCRGSSKIPLFWKLEIHGIQAAIALNQFDKAHQLITELLDQRNPNIPPDTLQALEEQRQQITQIHLESS